MLQTDLELPTCRPLRAASDNDVDALVTLINEAYKVEAFFAMGPRVDKPQVLELLESGSFLVVEAAPGKLAAAVHVDTERELGKISLLAVSPLWQGRGLGRRCVSVAELFCQSQGHSGVELSVVNLRSELFPFYERLGYREVGTAPFPTEEDTKRPCHFVLMQKDLDALS